jgi:hypothetical protein
MISRGIKRGIKNWGFMRNNNKKYKILTDEQLFCFYSNNGVDIPKNLFL